MLAIGRALMGRPRLLLMDEPSMGLAPLIVQEIFAIIRGINRARTSILFVEQNARQALRVAIRDLADGGAHGRRCFSMSCQFRASPFRTASPSFSRM